MADHTDELLEQADARWVQRGLIRRGSHREPLAVTALALMVNTATTSALGVVFWAVASRLYPPQQLGEDAALVSAMILLSTVSQLNLGMGIPRLLPQVQHRRWRPVLGAYGLTAVVGSIVAVGFVTIVPRISDGFAFLGDDPTLRAALVAAVVLWNLFALQDAVLTSARWAAVIPVENGLFGLLKIVAMVWFVNGVVGHGVFFAWLLAMALLLAPVNGLIFSRVLSSPRGRSVGPLPTVVPLGERAVVTRYLVTDYIAALFSQGSTALLPLLVVSVLGKADNAYFYITFLIVCAAGALAQSLSISLVVEGAHDEADLSSLARRSAQRYVKLVVPAVALAIMAAPMLLRPFGGAYVTNGTTLLRLLLAGTVPQAVVVLYLGVERVRARVSRVLAAEAATLVLVSGGAIVGMRSYGLTGLGLAWLVAQVGVAAVVAPKLWRVIGGTRSGSDARATVSRRRRKAEPEGAAAASPTGSSSTVDLLDAGAAVVAAALLVVVGLGITGVGRVVLALLFVTFVPGWAVLDYVPLATNASRVALAAALSLSLSTLTTVSVLWIHLWRPRLLLDVTATICLIAVIWHLAHPGDRPVDRTPGSRQ